MKTVREVEEVIFELDYGKEKNSSISFLEVLAKGLLSKERIAVETSGKIWDPFQRKKKRVDNTAKRPRARPKEVETASNGPIIPRKKREVGHLLHLGYNKEKLIGITNTT